tara:strand:+ start:617 stop:1600 length:984 start_codon:yes stop_codon:yes gene_type:complete
MKNIRKFCVAPMMGYTTPHARKLYRILTKRAYLFTEMIPTKTMIYSEKRDSIINNEINEKLVALQVGGSEIEDLKRCSELAKFYNYNEINLNVGCPSKAVQKGSFGACLMKDKILVRNCLESMQDSASIEVTLKCRIGIGKDFNYDFFYNFIDEISKSGITVIYVHARNAILEKLSPKNNRTIPPLNYGFVDKIKKEFKNIEFILNGGIDNLDKAYNLSKQYDGIMVGRLVQNNPFCLSKVDNMFFEDKKHEYFYQNIITEYFDYVKNQLVNESIFRLLSPLLNIFFGVPNSKKFRQEINLFMKKNKIDELEKLFLKFIADKKIYLN